MTIKMSKPYFSHDIDTRGDMKIKSLIYYYGYEGYGIYWAVIEFLHENELNEIDIPILANDLRIDQEKLENILRKTDLFKFDDGRIYSERVIRNLQLQEEKSKKAKKSVQKRWQNQNNKKEDAAKDSQEIDMNFVNDVISIYNTEFNKTQIVSNDTRNKIDGITKENNLTIEVWQQVFENARRGWDLKDGTHKTPSLNTILEKWDAFASGDYYLAPDRKKIAKQKAEAERIKAEQEEQERIAREKDREEYEAKRNAVHDAASAIEFLITSYKIPECMYAKSNTIREYSEKYGFSIQELIEARQQRGEIDG